MPRALDDRRDHPAEQEGREHEKAHGDRERETDPEARERGHPAPIVAATGMTPHGDPPPEERLASGKAVAAALLLAAVVFAALAVFLWVLFARGCGRPSL